MIPCKDCGAQWGHTPACRATRDMKALNNFIPMAGQATRRPGLKHVPFRRPSLWARFMRWWKDEPRVVSQMITFGQPQVLYVATDKGVFYLDDKSQTLKPISFTEPTSN